MKTTGIVRGIDALGRIVLPKELRTSMHLDSDARTATTISPLLSPMIWNYSERKARSFWMI